MKFIHHCNNFSLMHNREAGSNSINNIILLVCLPRSPSDPNQNGVSWIRVKWVKIINYLNTRNFRFRHLDKSSGSSRVNYKRCSLFPTKTFLYHHHHVYFISVELLKPCSLQKQRINDKFATISRLWKVWENANDTISLLK